MKNTELNRQKIIVVVFVGLQLEIEVNHMQFDFNDDIEPQSYWLFKTNQYTANPLGSLLIGSADIIAIFINKSEMFELRMQKPIELALQKNHVFIECNLEEGCDRPIGWPSIELLRNVVVTQYPPEIFQNRPKKQRLDTKDASQEIFYGENARISDALYQKARSIVLEHQRPSISLIQRHLGIGYTRGRALIEAMVGDILTEINTNGVYKILE